MIIEINNFRGDLSNIICETLTLDWVTLDGRRLNSMFMQVITLCETLAACDASVNNVPLGVLKSTRSILKSFEWARDAADRLAFAEVLSTQSDFSADMTETYRKLDIDPSSITTLEKYLEEYYSKILKKLKEVGASSKQTDFYV